MAREQGKALAKEQQEHGRRLLTTPTIRKQRGRARRWSWWDRQGAV
ncbi:MAG TPA: hypothetical protein VGF67_06720 [Ktedonobacteraceae bacterium]